MHLPSRARLFANRFNTHPDQQKDKIRQQFPDDKLAGSQTLHSRMSRALLPWNRRCRKLETGQRRICAAICFNLTPQHAFGLTCTLAACRRLKMCLFPPKASSRPLWRSHVLHALAEATGLIDHELHMGSTPVATQITSAWLYRPNQ